MKTLDEVINAFKIHEYGKVGGCDKCPYFHIDGCGNELHHDVLRFLWILREMQEDRNREILAKDEERKRENKAPILQVPEEKPQPDQKPEEQIVPWDDPDPWDDPEVELPADWIRVDNTAINPVNVLYVIYQDERTTVIMRGDRKLTIPGNSFGLEE
jgi:hypothetical protein